MITLLDDIYQQQNRQYLKTINLLFSKSIVINSFPGWSCNLRFLLISVNQIAILMLNMQ